MRSYDEQRSFKELLLADADVVGAMTPAEIEHAFDLRQQFRHVDDIFLRVFGTTVDASAASAAAADRAERVLR
jgi:adenylosuccinate lyase